MTNGQSTSPLSWVQPRGQTEEDVNDTGGVAKGQAPQVRGFEPVNNRRLAVMAAPSSPAIGDSRLRMNSSAQNGQALTVNCATLKVRSPESSTWTDFGTRLTMCYCPTDDTIEHLVLGCGTHRWNRVTGRWTACRDSDGISDDRRETKNKQNQLPSTYGQIWNLLKIMHRIFVFV